MTKTDWEEWEILIVLPVCTIRRFIKLPFGKFLDYEEALIKNLSRTYPHFAILPYNVSEGAMA